MKKKTFNQTVHAVFILLSLVTLFISCEKVKDMASVTIPIKPSPVVFTVEKAADNNNEIKERELKKFTLDTQLNYHLEKNGFSSKNIRSFKLIKANVQCVDLENHDINDFAGMKIYIGTSQDFVAEAKKLSSDKKTLTFEISSDNIEKHIKTDKLPILIKGPNPVKENNVDLSIQLEFEARVTPL